jgi:tetratricopeptide (TPR) repeat protein
MTKTIRHELIAWIFEYRGELICPSAYIEGRVEVAKLLPDVILTLKNALRQRDPPEDLLPALVGLKFRLSVNRDVAKELLGLLEAWKGGEDYAPLSMAKSTLLAQLGRYDESLNAAVTALDADPRSVAALLTLSYAQSRSGLYIQAEKTARQATDVAPYDDYAWLALGIVLARQGDHDGSALALERACMINPRSARAWCSLGVTYDLQGRLNESIDACEHSIELDPRNVDAWHILGIAYDRDGRTEEAVKALREAKRLSNSDGAVSLSLSRALYSAGQTEESLTALKNAEALLKAAADVERLSAVSIAYRKNGYPKQAGELASHVLTIAPNHFDAQLTLAISLGQLAAYKKEAQEARIRLGQLCRSADDWYELSVAYGTAGYFEDAVTAAQCALKIDPRHQAAWRNLILDFAHLPGHEKDSLQARLRLRELCRTAEDWCELSVACGRIRQHKEAIDAAQKALDIDPHHVPSLQSLARNLGALGQHNETLPIISRIEELDAEHATADRTKLKRKKQAVKANPLSPILWTHMAQTYRYAGRSTEAIAIAREIVQESPEAAPHCIGLAKDLLAFEPEAVASLITYLLTFDPTNTNYLHLRGVAKEKSGKAGEAIEDHKLACERDPDQEGYWYALGKAFEALHRRAEAMNAYKRAVTINQHYEKAQKAFDRLASHAERGDS